jgi:biopolymer transport protein ExbD
MAFGAGGGSPDEVKGDINVTPLVDVCLVLLIIFMVVTPMLQSGVDVALPQGAHSEKKPGKESDLIISIKQDGTVFIGQDWIPDRDLPRYMKAEHDKTPGRNVMVKADKRINFGKVRMVMKAANDADFTAVSFLTENQMAGKQIKEHGL